MGKCFQCGLPEKSQPQCDEWDCPAMRAAQLGISLERLQHGSIAASASSDNKKLLVYDTEGRPSVSLAPRGCDVLGTMKKRGAITEEMAKAGSRFKADSYRASLDTRRACSNQPPPNPAQSGISPIPLTTTRAGSAARNVCSNAL